METVTLTGITWNHTRGFVPLVAAAQRWSELYPHIQISWQKRSLQEFADYPIQKLAERFDMIVIDHPFCGYAADHPVLVPLDEYLAQDYLDDQEANSVGVSHRSYQYGGHQWALAIDAATPIATWRPDLLDQHNIRLPETWDELLELARRGLVAVPAIPVDCLMNFFMLCVALGEEPVGDNPKNGQDRFVSEATGVAALEKLRELVVACSEESLKRNPIAVYEAMTQSDEIAYCPFAYGYSNYSRTGYARKLLQSGGLVTLNGTRLRSTLGGTGLAVSARSPHIKQAADFAQYVASPLHQRTLYTQSGGQPGHRTAWVDTETNAAATNYFRDTLQTLDEAYLRPRYNGYMHYQDEAGPVVHRFLREGGNPRPFLDEMEEIYRQSREQR